MIMPEEDQKIEEPKVENAVKDEPKVYRCHECADKIFGGCIWDEAKNGPLPKDKCVVHPPMIAGKKPVWVIEEKKEEGKGEEVEKCPHCGATNIHACPDGRRLCIGCTATWAKGTEEDITKALEKHGVATTITDDLKAKMPEDLQAAVAAGAPVVVILDRAEDHNTWSIGSTKDFRKANSFAKMGNRISPEQAELLQEDFNKLLEVQSHLHDRIKTTERELRQGEMDIKEAQEVLKEMDDMRKAKAAAEGAAKKEHEDWMKLFNDHKNMTGKYGKTKVALQELKAGIKELYDRHKD